MNYQQLTYYLNYLIKIVEPVCRAMSADGLNEILIVKSVDFRKNSFDSIRI